MQLLETLWEASDHRCGKRLAAVLPTLVEALERHGHLEIRPARFAQGGQDRRRCLRIVTRVPMVGANVSRSPAAMTNRSAQLIGCCDGGCMGRMGRQRIEKLQQQCDPAALLGAIRHNQAALVNGAAVLVDRSGRLRMLSFALCNPCPTAPPLAPTRLQSTHPIPAGRSWRSRLIS